MPLDQVVIAIVGRLHELPTELVSLLLTAACGLIILMLHKHFRLTGLMCFNAIAIFLGNIQVLRVAKFSVSPEPIALGTVLFAATFLVTDIINELYGRENARKSVYLSFTIYIAMTILMIIDLGHEPDLDDKNYRAMETLFTPSLRFFIASILAFFIGQITDIALFNWVKKTTKNSMLWLRTNLSTFISGLIDNFIFSLLAWIIFAPIPITMHTLIFTYVIGAYAYRGITNILLTPVIYKCKQHVKRDETMA